MPKGKILPPGGIAMIPHLPDCANEEWLFSSRKKGTPGPTEAKKIEYRSRVNEAVKLYIGTIMTDSAITQTEQNDIIDKASIAAKKLLAAMQSKKEDRAKKWRKEIAARTDYNTLGNITWVQLNTLLRLKGGDINTLSHYPFISGVEPVSQVYLTSVKIRAKMQSPEQASSSIFRDPPLLRFIAALGGVWKEATGLTPTPKSERWKDATGKYHRDDTDKFYRFAEWVWAIIRSANLGLEENYQTCLQRMRERGQTKMLGVPAPEWNVPRWQIEEPREGSIIDIVRYLSSKKEKSGTPCDNG